MRRRIFLDVGAHEGQTLDVLRAGGFHFDEIHCFEPMPRQFEILRENYGHWEGLTCHPMGLANFEGERNIYGTNENLGASLFQDKVDLIEPQTETLCRFMKATDFFKKHLDPDDFIWMKLNCEGGEVLILEDLIRGGVIDWVYSAWIDFDVRKIPSKRWEKRRIVGLMREVGFRDFCTPRQVPDFFFWLRHWDHAGETTFLSRLPRWMRIMVGAILRKARQIGKVWRKKKGAG